MFVLERRRYAMPCYAMLCYAMGAANAIIGSKVRSQEKRKARQRQMLQAAWMISVAPKNSISGLARD